MKQPDQIPQYVKDIVWFHKLRAVLNEEERVLLDWYVSYVSSSQYDRTKGQVIVLD